MPNTVKIPQNILDACRGTAEYNADIASFTWFRVGGKADMLYRPADSDDLAFFLKHLDPQIPVTILGAGSNVIIRDGGFRGVILKLGRGFSQMNLLENERVQFGTAVPDVNASKFLLEHHLAGGEFLRGIPGTLGGALRMNAGAYEGELKDIFVRATGVTRAGDMLHFTADDMGFTYRQSLPQDIFYTDVLLQLQQGNPDEILAKMNQITQSRQDTQPIKARTGGSTFKNPEGHKAWQLIDQAGCRGMRVNDAQMSELHCNFMLNLGGATAQDLETLGEQVRAKVLAKSGVQLHWEIKFIGDQ